MTVGLLCAWHLVHSLWPTTILKQSRIFIFFYSFEMVENTQREKNLAWKMVWTSCFRSARVLQQHGRASDMLANSQFLFSGRLQRIYQCLIPLIQRWDTIRFSSLPLHSKCQPYFLPRTAHVSGHPVVLDSSHFLSMQPLSLVLFLFYYKHSFVKETS